MKHLRALILLGVGLLAALPAQAAPISNGRLYYDINTDTPQVRTYTAGSPGSFSAASATQSGGSNHTFHVLRAAPSRNERMAGYVTNTGELFIRRWTGASWSSEWSFNMGGDGVNGRRFDIAYENLSGDAVVVFSGGTSGSNELRYRIWDGSNWTSETNLDSARLAQTATWVKLVARPGTDEIALTTCDTGTTTANTAILTTLVWDGSAWGSEPATAHSTTVFNTTGQLVQNDLFDMAYEGTTGDLMVVWSDNVSNKQHWRRFSGGPPRTWGSTTDFGSNRNEPTQWAIASDPTSGNLAAIFSRNANAAIYATVWTGSAWSAVTQVNTGENATDPVNRKKNLAVNWLVYGGTSYPVFFWGTTATTPSTLGYNYATVSGTTVTWGTAAAYDLTNVGSTTWNWLEAWRDPLSADTLMLLISEGGGSLWAKQLQLTAAPPGGLTWGNADANTALTTALGSVNSQNFSFAFDRIAPATTTLGDSSVPATSTSVCPGNTGIKLDGFSLANSAGTSSVTGLTVTLTNYAAIQSVGVYSEAGTQYFTTLNAPTSNTLNFTGGTAITVTTTPADYKVVVSYKTEGSAPTGATTTTAVVGTLLTTNTVTGTDTAEATVTLDNEAPTAGASWGATTASEGQVALNWTYGAGGTFALVVRYPAQADAPPTDGTFYTAGQTLGTGTVVYAGSLLTFTDTGVQDGTTYHYRIFEHDLCGNYVGLADAPWSGPLTPRGLTTLANGLTGSTTSVCPGATNQRLAGFSFQTDAGSAPVTGLTVTTTGYEAIASASIYSDAGTQHFTTISPVTSNTLVFSGGTAITATTTLANYWVVVAYKGHAAAPTTSTLTNAYVSAVGTGNNFTGTDAVDSAITLNNAAPPSATWGTTTAGDGSVALSWTIAGAGDSVVIARYSADTDPTLPTDGASYSMPATIGTGTVVYTGSGTSFTDSPVTNGSTYYYRIFERDSCLNYVATAGTAPWSGALTPKANTTLGPGTGGTTATVCPGEGPHKLDGFTLANSQGAVPVTGLTVNTTGFEAIQTIAITNDAGTTTYFTTSSAPTSNTTTFSGGNIPVTTTAAAFRVMVTYRSESQSPATGNTATNAYVSNLVTANTVTGADTTDTTITVNNTTPTSGATWGTNTAGDRTITLNWTYGSPSTGHSVLIVRYDSGNTDTATPQDGTTYTAGTTPSFGTGGTVRYVGNASTFVDNAGLVDATTYHYRIFQYDGCRNYVAGANAPWSAGLTSRGVTTLGNGTAGTTGTVCPGTADRKLDGFSLQNSAGTTGVTALTLDVTGFDAIETISIWDEAAIPTQYFSTITRPTSGTIDFTGGSLPVGTTATNYKVLVTYRNESQSPPAGSTATTARVTKITTLNSVAGTDTADTTVTLNNAAPAGATWGATTAGDGTITLNWTKSVAGNGVVVVRYTANTDTAMPSDGSTYVLNASYGGGGTIRSVGTAATSLVDNVGIVNGTTYYYRIWEYDSCLNYSTTAPWTTPGLTPKAATTLGNGSPGTNATLCPGTADQKLDGFSLANSQGSNPVTGLTVTLTGAAAIQSISIWDDSATPTQYFTTVSSPTGPTVDFSGGTPIPVGTSTANFKILVTLDSEAQTPPAGSTTVTARVTGLVTVNNVIGTDTADTTLTLNNVTPSPGASWAASAAGDGQVTLNWSLGAAGHYVVLVRYPANSDTALPVDDTVYTVGSAFGSGGLVRYAGNLTTFIDTGLVNGTTYYYRLFEHDGCLNYVATQATAPWTSTGLTPKAVTTLGNGVAAASATVCPGTADQKLDGFSLVNSNGANPVTALTVTVTGNAAIQTASVWDEAGTTQYFDTISQPASTTLSFSGGTPIPVGTTAANYKVVVTYRGETQSPPAGTTTTTARVSAITTANTVTGSDSADGTVSLDNLAPSPGATWTTTTAGSAQVTLAWTIGGSGDGVVIARYTASSDATFPTEGAPYTAGDTFGIGGTIVYAGTGTTFIDSAADGTTYYYRIFEHDGCRNYAALAPWSVGLTPRAITTLGNGVAGANASVCPGSAAQKLDGFSLVNNEGTTPVTALTVTTTGRTAIQSASIWNEAGTTQYFTTLTQPASNTLAFSGGTPLPVTTTVGNFKILVTYRSEAQSPPAGLTPTTAYVSALTTASNTVGTDSADTTLTLNNVTPTPGPTLGTVTGTASQNTLGWTFGTSGNAALVVRYTVDGDTAMPADGTAYPVGSSFGSGGTVVYAGTATTFNDTGIAAGTLYFYRLFEADACLNYATTASCNTNCGACNATCTNPHGTTSCVAGTCAPTCSSGYGDCDTLPKNGCETPIDSINHCGACGRRCTNANGTTSCVAGACTPVCAPGWANADGDPVNGCEARCNTSARCGTDCQPCQAANATTSCLAADRPAAQACAPVCAAGYLSLDSNGANGCEAACTDDAHCGSDCRACSRQNVRSVACAGNTAAAAQSCDPVCQAGFLDVDQDGLTGCEARCDQPDRCGTTCGACPAHVNATLGCSGNDKELAQACTATCKAGWTRPDQYGECVTECTAVDHCGSDCAVCPTAVNADPICKGGSSLPAAQSCGLACAQGYADVDGKLSTGCEGCAQGYYNTSLGSAVTCAACDVASHCGVNGPTFCRDCTSDFQDGIACTSGRCGCETKADCPVGKVCRRHACVRSCTTESDCSDTERCCGPEGEKSCIVWGEETCDGKDNDCNGQIDDGLKPATAPACAKQEGVCKGSKVACADGVLASCTDAVYAAYSPDFEAVESRCDGKDNDCNGKTDEAAGCAGADAGLVRVDGGESLGSYDLGGCGCSQAAGPSALALLLLGLGGLGARRRRR